MVYCMKYVRDPVEEKVYISVAFGVRTCQNLIVVYRSCCGHARVRIGTLHVPRARRYRSGGDELLSMAHRIIRTTS